MFFTNPSSWFVLLVPGRPSNVQQRRELAKVGPNGSYDGFIILDTLSSIRACYLRHRSLPDLTVQLWRGQKFAFTLRCPGGLHRRGVSCHP
ncbi:hypothetical protein Taro_006549 [Colocasia esculenta]|uniref:Uncharacterized protein n=1 Tax=Colocasia esculenta TaxID=4460 RepID=A0A843TST1_COLES|nr:hypothetical protein [Colocasia esculenta]